ncbi:MAG TPA: glycosyltransferase [Anaeromyxobacteraceae bacterium]|jgi:spore maturation protein CgeB|nr:glycosyltransferase [Anaeromyxobacteraceae bacterium]
MRFALFVHSLRSDWNHGNAHFLRGVASELVARGHAVLAFEPEGAWSAENLVRDHGAAALEAWRGPYPELAGTIRLYRPEAFDPGEALEGVDVALVHEWNDPALVARLGEERTRRPALRLLFHDTHHRAATRPEEMARFDLSRYDGVLAFGRAVERLYRERGWARRVFTWHEAADVRRFRPLPSEKEGDLVFVGNWGDEERTEELREFLLGPVKHLGIAGVVHGVRYPPAARRELAAAGLAFQGYLPNFQAPLAFARHRVTVHVPRRPYARALPGIPTIRAFEALACGIPLVCAPWDDAEGLFRPGRDYLVARDGAEMRLHLAAILREPALARSLAESGLETIRARHTCAHRVDELLGILGAIGDDFLE